MRNSIRAWLIIFFLLLVPAEAGAVCVFNLGNLGLGSSFDCVDKIREKAKVKDAQPSEIIITFLRVALSLAAIIAVVAIVVSGFIYITAGADERKAEKAKDGLKYAIIGLVVIGISVAIVNLVVNTLQGKEALPAADPGKIPPFEPVKP